ncbi:hypothetical protein H6P81_019727 [Aristolochia fimbriata]|uniref:Uncharacterized protein n=1 Tax=Aristolochia fimbriata TaxID=158543 RepID=A0AAV7DVP6_ARIFI|nr:hypothetical protein H6P81_019727 [Aristolochia fimbriata]
MPKSRRTTTTEETTTTLLNDLSPQCVNVSTYISNTLTAIHTDSVIVSSGVSITTHVLPVTEAVPDIVSDALANPATSGLGGLRFLPEFTALGESSSSMAPPPWSWSPAISLDDKLLDFLCKRGEIVQKEVVQYEKLARLKRHEVVLIDHLLKEFGKGYIEGEPQCKGVTTILMLELCQQSSEGEGVVQILD